MSENSQKREKYDSTKKINLFNEFSPKFIRLPKLTPNIRLDIAYIAYEAQERKEYGVITALAEMYSISRPFIYELSNRLKEAISLIFAPSQAIEKLSKQEIIEKIISQRMEGKTAIEGISTILRREGIERYSSTGFISQSLSAIGKLLPSVQALPMDREIKITALLDEIFIGSTPILITIEPKSSAILNIQLADNRNGKSWSNHINEIVSQENIEIINTVTDGGKGLLKGIDDALPTVNHQPDTFHMLSHRLGIFVSRFEDKAYACIAKEYEKEQVCLNRKTVEAFDKKQKEYEEASTKSEEAIDRYENFSWLYGCAIKQLSPFLSTGEVRNPIKAKEEIEVALTLMELLEHGKIINEVKSIKKSLPNLLGYFEQAKEALIVCKSLGLDEDNITAFSLAWQWDRAVIKAKKTDRKHTAIKEKAFYVEYLKESLGTKYEEIKEKVFDALDNIIQASSMVECINSLLRPYLNASKNQVSQEFLNLFAFYHNHRRYRSGKRKGKTPMEILTKEENQEDWLKLLSEFVTSKESTFFL